MVDFLSLGSGQSLTVVELPMGWPFWKTQADRVDYVLSKARKLSEKTGKIEHKYITTGQWYEIGLPRFSSIFSVLRKRGYVIESERLYKDGKATSSFRSWLVWKPGDAGPKPASQGKLFN